MDLEFEVHQMGNVRWHAVSGLYVFAGPGLLGGWQPYYIGQAESLAERLPNHENLLGAARLGATHIHARVEPMKFLREAQEADLIRRYQPILNVQHR